MPDMYQISIVIMSGINDSAVVPSCQRTLRDSQQGVVLEKSQESPI